MEACPGASARTSGQELEVLPERGGGQSLGGRAEWRQWCWSDLCTISTADLAHSDGAEDALHHTSAAAGRNRPPTE